MFLADAKEQYLYSISYREFLSRHLDISEPEVFAALQYLATDSSVGIESATAGSRTVLYRISRECKATGIPSPRRG